MTAPNQNQNQNPNQETPMPTEPTAHERSAYVTCPDCNTAHECDAYNGWPNRETWAFVLLIDNDEWSYHEARHVAVECDRNKYGVADALRDWFDSMGDDDAYSGWYTSTRFEVGSLWRVDWVAVAEAMLDLPEDDDYCDDPDCDDDHEDD